MYLRIVSKAALLCLVCLALWSLAYPTAVPAAEKLATYRITITNLATKQALSPPLFVVHRGNFRLFRVGTYASDAVRWIAENGHTAPAADIARATKGIVFVRTQGAIILGRGSMTIQVQAPVGSLLTVATMLEQSNDGFTGIDGVRLPAQGAVTFNLRAYDAGTEANNELATHVPGAPFGGGSRAITKALIANHPGIKGVGDMNAKEWGWREPIGQLTMTKLD